MDDVALRGRFAGHAGPVVQAAYCPTGELLATVGMDGPVRWWDAKTGMELAAASSDESPSGYGAIAFSRA